VGDYYFDPDRGSYGSLGATIEASSKVARVILDDCFGIQL